MKFIVQYIVLTVAIVRVKVGPEGWYIVCSVSCGLKSNLFIYG